MLETILAPIVAWVVHTIQWMGYPGIVILMAIESACIPLPSEVIMPFSGYLVSIGHFNLHAAALAGAFGCAVGSAITYWIGAREGRPLLEKYGRYLLIRRHDLEMADRFFQRWGMWAAFISRLLPVVRTFISLPAGVSRVKFLPFITLTFLGSWPWCYALAYVGKVLGENWQSIRTYFRGADIVIVLFFAACAAFWLWHHLRPDPEDLSA